MSSKYHYEQGNSAKGIDLPSLGVDIKVTSIKQPQSSCPFQSARQKIYGLGYALLFFVYEKIDCHQQQTSNLNIKHTVFIDKDKTADFQTTMGIKEIINRKGNIEDLLAFFEERRLPVDDIEAVNIASNVLQSPQK